MLESELGPGQGMAQVRFKLEFGQNGQGDQFLPLDNCVCVEEYI